MSYDSEEKMVRESKGGYGLALMGFEQTGVFGQGKASLPSISIMSLLQWIKPTIGMTIGGHSGGGTGPYKCTEFRSHPGLPKHTIYQPDPTTLPPDVKLPVLLWGNGACVGWGGWFSKFLAEIASHGYFVIANGIPEFSGVFTKTKWTDMIDAMNWVDGNAGTGAYAHIDATRIAVAGQSCGGLQAFTASLDPRVTLTCIFNSGLINEENTGLFEKLHAPVGFFLGGPSDIAFVNGERDYKNMPAKIPSVKLNLPVGHMGTYGSANGGQFGRAAVSFLEWQMKGDKISAKLFLDQESTLTKDGWGIVSKGYDESRQVKQPPPRKPIINLLPITDVRSMIEERKSKKNISGKPDRTVKL